MKVALCFWGLTRSLKYTLKSIQKQIITPLKDANIEYKIFVHTYEFESAYHNPRSKEQNIKLDFQEYKLLEPDYFQIENQDEIKEKINLKQYRTQPDPWENNYISMDNFLCAMYSKKQLGAMIQNSEETFDACVFLRPDTFFLNPLDIHYFSLLQNNRICAPNFHLFPDFNDRFLICSQKHMLTYTQLFDDMLHYSRHCSLHSERFQYALLTQKYKLIILYMPIHFNRVRADGRILRDYQPEKKKYKLIQKQFLTNIYKKTVPKVMVLKSRRSQNYNMNFMKPF